MAFVQPLSRSTQTPSSPMASGDVLFVALGLIAISVGTFFFFQASLSEVVTQGLDNTAAWAVSAYGTAALCVTAAGAFLTLCFLWEAQQRNQGSLLLLGLLAFGWAITPLLSSSTHDVLMGRTKVLNLLSTIRQVEGSASSEEARLMAALKNHDEMAINQATSFTWPKETQELIVLAEQLGVNSRALREQGFATLEQTEHLLSEARSQGAPLHILNQISLIQSSQRQQSLGWKQPEQERGRVQ